ncbi:MAG TPA: ATPase, T2SS/T4P/T4SS family [Polyangiaceae bacterium]|nr:ATPase, T2SS/T4P/T4SS family [Polyangiaceae bacterium]
MTSDELHFQVIGQGGAGRQELSFAADRAVAIGRDETSDIPLFTSNVSRKHATVEWTPDGLKVTDTSSNGTLVNGLLLKRATRVLPEGQVTLSMGFFRIKVALKQPKSKLPVLPVEEGPSSEVRRAPTAPPPPPELSSPGAVTSSDVRRGIHRRLLENLDLPALDRAAIGAPEMRPQVVAALRRIVAEMGTAAPRGPEQEALVQELADEALGLGPLERLLADTDVSEIMVVDPQTIFVERRGKMQLTGLRFTDDDSVRAVIERIVTPLGRRIDESTPLVDARLRDGSRVNAVIPPLALRGPCITIRKFAKEPLRMSDLQRFGSVSDEMAQFLENAVQIRKNIIISGGTGSGKTTLLNVLSGAIPSHERVVTVEDAAELQLAQPHVVSLEARPPNLEGKGEYSIRDLVKNALRMRPDRIVVGECRGGEAIDMLQAMNTGHEGSLTTTHANSPKEAVARIETLCLMAGLDLPVRAIRQQIVSSIHLIVQQSRFSDGSRRVTSVAEVVGIDDDGEVELREIFRFKMKSAGVGKKVEGEFLASGYLPSFLDQFLAHGLLGEDATL